MKKEDAIYVLLLVGVLIVFIVLIWGVQSNKAREGKDFLECIQATQCYKCASVSNKISTAEICGLEQNPFFEELDKDAAQWCYEKFIK